MNVTIVLLLAYTIKKYNGGFKYHSNKKECGVNSCAPFMGFCPFPSPTGPIGPQGITGPTGPTGPTGTTGSVEANPYNLYV